MLRLKRRALSYIKCAVHDSSTQLGGKKVAVALFTRRHRRTIAGVMSAIATVMALAAPTANADPDPWEIGTRDAVCFLTSGALASVTRAITRGVRGSALLSGTAGAGASGACPIVFDRWSRGYGGNVKVNTPSGQTISQMIYQSQLEANLPMDSASINRRVQCAGWASVPAYYELCNDYKLDPIYR